MAGDTCSTFMSLVRTILLSTFFSISLSQPTSNHSRCLPEFWRTPQAFERVKKIPTFILLNDPPNIFMTKKLQSEPGLPFLCSDLRVSGAFGYILHELSRSTPELLKALCIYGGPKCSFDDEAAFVGYVARSGSGHQFIAGAYLLFMEHRRTPGTVQSAPIVVDSMVLLYRDNKKLHPWTDAFNRIFKPFGPGGWLVILAFAILWGVCKVLFVLRFSPSRLSFNRKVLWLFEHHDEKHPVRVTCSKLFLAIGYTAFLAVLILIYEVAIAVAVFKVPDPIVTDIQQLRTLDVNTIAVFGGASSESILRKFVDPEDKYLNLPPPWKRGRSFSQMMRWLQDGYDDEKNPVSYLFSYRSSVKYALKKMNLCNMITAITLGKEETGGFIYSTAIPEATRLNIDKSISRIFMDRVPVIAMKQFGQCPLSIGPREEEIGHRVLLLLFGCAVAPFVLLFLATLLPWREEEEQEENHVKNTDVDGKDISFATLSSDTEM